MILLLGGTTEARQLAYLLYKNQIDFIYSVTSEYAASLLDLPIKIQNNKLDFDQLKDFIKKNRVTKIFDLTHPFAEIITKNAIKIAQKLKIDYIKYDRKDIDLSSFNNLFLFNSQNEAAQFLFNKNGNILLTTGSNKIDEWNFLNKKRIFLRILPNPKVIEKCLKLNFKADHIIAQQGPFSIKENIATIERYHIKFLVTKESGVNSGFLEKIKATKKTNINTIIIKRPELKDNFKRLSNIEDFLKICLK